MSTIQQAKWVQTAPKKRKPSMESEIIEPKQFTFGKDGVGPSNKGPKQINHSKVDITY
jgi:hypothetical protein